MHLLPPVLSCLILPLTIAKDVAQDFVSPVDERALQHGSDTCVV